MPDASVGGGGRKESHSTSQMVLLAAAQMGFFAEAGPVQIFVSNHLIPEDFEFSALDDPCYVSSDEEVRL